MSRTPQQILDELLVLRLQAGEPAALTELISRWYDNLLGRARLLVRDEADAADAVQESLIAMARTIRRLDDPALFGAWIRRILAHKCADAIRRRQQNQRLARNALHRRQVDHQSKPDQADDALRVRLAIDQLPIEQRALLVMRYAREMTTEQMAVALRLREGTVKSRLHHARTELKSILERSM